MIVNLSEAVLLRPDQDLERSQLAQWVGDGDC